METRKHFLIVNLIAGQGRCKALFPGVRKELDRRGVAYDLHYTNEPMEAKHVAQMGIDAGFTHIVAMGGDGTINEVANGLVGSEAILAVIPAGTGNDFVRMTGIPGDPIRAIDLLQEGTPRTIDLGRVADDRCFVNGLGIGIDAQVGRNVLKRGKSSGARVYLTEAIKEVFRFQAFPVRLEGDGWSDERACLSLGVANGRYCGGGFQLAPRASIDDGLIDIAAIGDFPKLERLIRLPQARKGNHLKLGQVFYRQAGSVTISSEAKLIAHVDGEPYQLPREGAIRVEAVPLSLRVLVPS